MSAQPSVKGSPSDLAAALIVCALALVALARSERAPAVAAPVAPARVRVLPTAAAVAQLRRGEPLDLNTASAADLVLLPGIGPKLAERILAERARLGTFTRLEELQRVRGVGPTTFERLRPLLRISDPRAASP